MDKILSARFGKVKPDSVVDYVNAGGYEGLKKAIKSSPLDTIGEIKKAKLFGRGGAGYETGPKWEKAYHIQCETRYMVCNCDEGEPGTFKDKYIIEKDPFELIEGMTIGAYLMGSKEGFIYIRGEYAGIQEVVKNAIEDARKKGYLGKNILGKKGFDFDLKVVSGAGAYICGENTALIESIEGKTGRPRQKPPYLSTCGLFQKPTILNNVETYACIPWIVKDGGEAFLKKGTKFSGGTKLVCLSGNVVNRGVYEIPFGMTLRELIYDIGGGVPSGRKLKFVHMGGQSGSCFPATYLDTKICYDDLKKAGISLGSGAIVCVDDSHCVVDYLKNCMEFFEEESCGKCTPCREGTYRLVQLCDKLTRGDATIDDFEKMKNLAKTMRMVSFCGLGQSAPVALLTLIKHFEDEFIEHINGKCITNECCMSGKVDK